jgi:hypothetical protein
MRRTANKLDKLNWDKRACAVFLLCATARLLSAQTFTTLHSFDVTDGQNPYAGLVQGINGDTGQPRAAGLTSGRSSKSRRVVR